MSLLAPVGTCSYNGVDLNPAETETLSLNHQPISDPTGRTVSYVQTTIQIKTVIYKTDGNTTDATINSIIAPLTQYGGAFRYDTKGGGTIHANVLGETAKDVCFGPKPRVIQLIPIGQFAWRLIWEVVICLPQCTNATYENALMEMNFGLTFSIDESGYTTRNYRGHLKIPSTRQFINGRTLKYNADQYRRSIYPSPVAGFRRTAQEFTLSEDKMRLDFSITDVEMPPNVPPPGIVKVDASHSHSHSMGQGSGFGPGMWTGNLEATYELQKGWPPDTAFIHFGALLQQRAKIIENSRAVKTASSDKSIVGQLILTGLSCSEPTIYGKTLCRFQASYMVVSGLKSFLTDGLWVKTPASDWFAWRFSMNSMTTGAEAGRGLAVLSFKNTDDSIIDLCLKAPPPPASLLNSNTRTVLAKSGVSEAIATIENPIPSPASSWLNWRNSLWLETKDGTVAHSPLVASSLKTQSDQSNGLLRLKSPFVSTDGYSPAEGNIGISNLIQVRTAPVCHIIMEGEATRVGYEIDVPELVEVDGVQCVRANKEGCGVKQTKIWDFFGLPVYHCVWRKRYVLDRTPKTVSVAPHPFLDQTKENRLSSPMFQGGLFPT